MNERRQTNFMDMKVTLKELVPVVAMIITAAIGYTKFLDRMDTAEHRLGDIQSQLGELSAKVGR